MKSLEYRSRVNSRNVVNSNHVPENGHGHVSDAGLTNLLLESQSQFSFHTAENKLFSSCLDKFILC
jgi:hypothetical protein